jgi:hypothetical protein
LAIFVIHSGRAPTRKWVRTRFESVLDIQYFHQEDAIRLPSKFMCRVSVKHTVTRSFHSINSHWKLILSRLVRSSKMYQLRARITLNRSAFNAVRARRSKDPLAPRLCRQCSATPPETARHVLVFCPRYSARRDELKKQLREMIERIRKAKQLQSRQWRRCIQNDDELLFHIILATPLVLAQLSDSHDRAYLLRCTGDFLLSVHDIRPT